MKMQEISEEHKKRIDKLLAETEKMMKEPREQEKRAMNLWLIFILILIGMIAWIVHCMK